MAETPDRRKKEEEQAEKEAREELWRTVKAAIQNSSTDGFVRGRITAEPKLVAKGVTYEDLYNALNTNDSSSASTYQYLTYDELHQTYTTPSAHRQRRRRSLVKANPTKRAAQVEEEKRKKRIPKKKKKEVVDNSPPKRLYWWKPKIDIPPQEEQAVGRYGPMHPVDPANIARPSSPEEANLISSLCEDGMHAPVLDLDFPAKLVPSSTPGHYHLYLDKKMDGAHFRYLLEALGEVGILEPGYVEASISANMSMVRPVGVYKPGARSLEEMEVRLETAEEEVERLRIEKQELETKIRELRGKIYGGDSNLTWD